MKRTMYATCFAMACSVGAVMAQTATADKAQMKDHDQMKKGTVMVTGCVADKDSTGRYLLNNATMAEQMSTTAPSATPAPAAAPLSFALSGGDIKDHVGHKVEVTGTIDADKKDDKATGTSGSPTMATMDHDKTMTHVLKVKSVKMLAATCQ